MRVFYYYIKNGKKHRAEYDSWTQSEKEAAIEFRELVKDGRMDKMRKVKPGKLQYEFYAALPF